MLRVEKEVIDKITEVFYRLLKGKTTLPIELPDNYPDNEIKQLTGYINKFINEYNVAKDMGYNLSRGDINFNTPSGNLIIQQSLKSLQASLKNLTWTTQQIAKGNFKQQVTFMGEFSDAFNHMAKQLQDSFLNQTESTKILHEQIDELAGTRLAMLNIMEDLEDAKKTAESATKTKSDFLANMSHEIRTPMNAIIGLTHLALQTKLTTKQDDYLNKVHSSAQSLLIIINDILDFSKMEAGKIEIEYIDFELQEIFDKISTLISMKANDKGLELLFQIDNNIPKFLRGDPLRVGQVLINLANNAVKFTTIGQIIINAKLIKQIETQITIQFSVQDTGIGLTYEQIKKLFQPFSQADTSTTRKYGGTGLGLTISKRLVEMMGGKIWVESKAGQGSSFMFTIIFKNTIETNQKNIGEKKDMEGEILEKLNDIRGANILLVEDNEINQQVVKELLEMEGFIVTIANDGQKGINQIKKIKYDAVLMDVQMPVMGGYEATEIIRKDLQFKNLPILAMTADVMTTDKEVAMKAGMNDHIAKPIEPQKLFSTLIKWVPARKRELPAKFLKDRQNSGIKNKVKETLPTTLPGLNITKGVSTIGGNVKLYLNLLNKFSKNQSDAVLEIKSALEQNNLELAKRLTHTLKGVSGNIGAVELYTSTINLELKIKKKDISFDSFLLEKVQFYLQQVLSSITLLTETKEDKTSQEKQICKKIDFVKIKTLIKKLKELLEDDDTEALNVIEKLRELLKETEIKPALTRVEKQISQYDFEEALIQLETVKNKLKACCSRDSI